MINSITTDEQDYKDCHEKYICFPEKGILINRETLEIVGSMNDSGYIVTSFRDTTVGVHRIIYCMVHEHFPEITDHLNHIRYDNRINNLRDVNASGNAKNQSRSKNNISGVTGITQSKDDDKWIAKISHNNKQVSIGCFKFFINAVKARRYAEKKFGYEEYDFITSARAYLCTIANFDFHTNIELKSKSTSVRDSAKNEWDFYCQTKKQKIDLLAEK